MRFRQLEGSHKVLPNNSKNLYEFPNAQMESLHSELHEGILGLDVEMECKYYNKSGFICYKVQSKMSRRLVIILRRRKKWVIRIDILPNEIDVLKLDGSLEVRSREQQTKHPEYSEVDLFDTSKIALVMEVIKQAYEKNCEKVV